jgi:hypothetical protein
MVVRASLWRCATGEGNMTNAGQFQTGDGDHLLRSKFARSGGADDTALTEPQRDRLAVIRAELETPEGMIESLRDKAASLGLIVEWGQAWLKEKAETEGGPAAFESPMLARWFTSFEAFRRSVETLYKLTTRRDAGGLSIAEVLNATRRANGWVQTDMFNDEQEADDNGIG